MDVAWALFGRRPGHETLCLQCEVTAAGDERYLVCAAGAAAVVLGSNWFLVCVLQPGADRNGMAASLLLCYQCHDAPGKLCNAN